MTGAAQASPATTGPGAARRVSRGIMQALEQGQLVPGQKLVESDLAAQYGVGRNAVREAVQWLAAHGVMDTNRNKSAGIRLLDIAEAQEVLAVARALFGLIARSSAAQFRAGEHGDLLASAVAELNGADDAHRPGAFNRARRHFIRALLTIGGNRELWRLFPALSLHIVHIQFRQAAGKANCLTALTRIAEPVNAGDAARAVQAASAYIDQLAIAIGD